MRLKRSEDKKEKVRKGFCGLLQLPWMKCCFHESKKNKESGDELCGRNNTCTGNHSLLLYGIISITSAILMFILPPSEILTQIRIRMIPGFIPFKWWFEPPLDMIVNVYLFNITNAESFLDGTDDKMKLQEIGPVTYKEKLTHKNPVFNEKGTFSYTSKRELVYFPELNAVNLLNETIIMPNVAALAIPSYLSNTNFAVKFGFNIMMRSYKTQLLKKTTVYNYLWNATDPIVDVSSSIAPGLFPIRNVGIMAVIYANLETHATVYIGPKYDRTKFFLIDKYDGSEYLPKRGNSCQEKVVGSIDDTMYHLGITKNETLEFYSRGLCTKTKMKFVRDVNIYWMSAYRFEMPETFYNRTFPEENDCYKGSPTLPNGIIDCGPCYFDISVTASFPHFMYADELRQKIVGMKPEKAKHESYVVLEPSTGLPLEGTTRLQMNIAVKDMGGFTPHLQRFNNSVVPICWTEYFGGKYPFYMVFAIYLTAVLLPIGQVVVSILLVVLGMFLVYRYLRKRAIFIDGELNNQIDAEEANMFLEKQNKLAGVSKG